MLCGIYKIENKITKEVYIGCSSNITLRIQEHKRRFQNKNSKEYNCRIYKAIRKYGIDNFKFSVIELCKPNELPIREKYWISFYESVERGYNDTYGGYGYSIVSEKHHNASLTKDDVIDIRTRYKKLERKSKVYQDYKDKISKSGFHKVWNGYTWKNIMMDVYTQETILYHKHNTANIGETNGTSKLTDADVYNIRKLKSQNVPIAEVYKSYIFMDYKSFQNVWYGCNWKHIAF